MAESARRPILIVPGRERSHEVTLNVWAVIVGVFYLFGAPRSPAMSAMGPPLTYIYAVGLIVGGGLALAGSFWLSDLERSLELERAGLIALTGMLFIYMAAVFTVTGSPGLFAAGLVGAWAWANIRRALQCTRDLARLREPD